VGVTFLLESAYAGGGPFGTRISASRWFPIGIVSTIGRTARSPIRVPKGPLRAQRVRPAGLFFARTTKTNSGVSPQRFASVEMTRSLFQVWGWAGAVSLRSMPTLNRDKAAIEDGAPRRFTSHPSTMRLSKMGHPAVSSHPG